MPEELDEEQGFALSMKISNYTDLFSYFDHRSLKYRTISDDFITEAQFYFTRLLKNEELPFHQRFVFLVPQRIRDPETETVVISRLEEYFQYNLGKARSRHRYQIIKAVGLIFLSFIFILVSFGFQMIVAEKTSALYWVYNSLNTTFNILGWVCFWNSNDLILNQILGGKNKKKYNFLIQITRYSLGFRSSD